MNQQLMILYQIFLWYSKMRVHNDHPHAPQWTVSDLYKLIPYCEWKPTIDDIIHLHGEMQTECNKIKTREINKSLH